MNFEKWKQTIETNLPNLADAAVKGACVFAQLFVADIFKPFCLIFLEVGGSGKTLLLNIFSKVEGLVIAEDDFTRASLISHAANRSEEDLAKIDLLPQLKGKVYLVRDFSALFSKRDEELRNVLGLLTRALDGEGLVTRSGVHGQRGYTGKHLFMMLGASTPIPHRVWVLMNQLGSRIFAWYLQMPEKSDEELAEQITSKVSPKKKEKICAEATTEMFSEIQKKGKVKWDKSKEDTNLLLVIARIARLATHLRGYVDDDGFPTIEKPDRINYLLYNMTRGHALLQGRNYIDKTDLPITIEVALASTTIQKAKIIKLLLQNNGKAKTSQVIEALRCSRAVALKYMEEMGRLALCDEPLGTGEAVTPKRVGRPEDVITLSDDFKWFLSSEFKQFYPYNSKKVN